MGIGIWSLHYLGFRILSSTTPALERWSVVFSILATISASGLSLLVIAGKSDSGRRARNKNQPLMNLKNSPLLGQSQR